MLKKLPAKDNKEKERTKEKETLLYIEKYSTDY